MLAVHYSAQAVRTLNEIGRQRRRRMERALKTFAASEPAAGLGRIETALDIAGSEVLEERRVVLVYVIVPRRELLEKVWGVDFDRRLRNRRAERLTHGRW
jgi:hypothetical protein